MKINDFRGDLTDISAKKEAWPVRHMNRSSCGGARPSGMKCLWWNSSTCLVMLPSSSKVFFFKGEPSRSHACIALACINHSMLSAHPRFTRWATILIRRQRLGKLNYAMCLNKQIGYNVSTKRHYWTESQRPGVVNDTMWCNKHVSC